MGLVLTQQVNLYQSEFRHEPVLFCAKNVQVFAAVFVVFLLLISTWDYWQVLNQSQQLDSLSAQQQVLNKTLMQEKLSAPAQQIDPQLALTVSHFEQEYHHKRQILDALSGQTFGNTRGFSGYLAGLARQSVAGLWITGLDIRRGGKSMGLRGSAFRAELVPLLMQRLSKEQDFSGTEFNSFSLQRQKKPQRVDFILHTDELSEIAE